MSTDQHLEAHDTAFHRLPPLLIDTCFIIQVCHQLTHANDLLLTLWYRLHDPHGKSHILHEAYLYPPWDVEVSPCQLCVPYVSKNQENQGSPLSSQLLTLEGQESGE